MKRPEQALQIQVAQYIDTAYPGALWLHIPNGGARSKVEGAIFKKMGVRAGAPDVFMVLPNGLAAFIELKAGKGSLSEAQKLFRDRAKALGCLWEEARSLADVEGILAAWLHPYGWTPRARVSA